MKILAHVPYSWPQQRGGSEVALHRLLAWLAARGHDVRCIVTKHRGTPTDGVRYLRTDSATIRDLWRWADIGLSQHTGSIGASELGAEAGTPVAHLAHNLHVLDAYADGLNPGDLMIWNSEWARRELGGQWAGPDAVCAPVAWPSDYSPVDGSGAVTQVNLSPLKGGALFWQLTRDLPDTRFLAVVGGWGPQLAADGASHPQAAASGPLAAAAPPNVAVQAPTSDVAGDVLARTRVLVMPTGQVSALQPGESYGLIAAEACCAGIPVVATYSPGTAEALGDAGIWCDPDKPQEWADHLQRLANPVEWRKAHEAALAQARRLDPTPALVALERKLVEHSEVSCR